MKNQIIALAGGMMLMLFASLMANLNTDPINHSEETRGGWGDSINVRYVGNWPFGGTRQVAYDSVRKLGFCASGGGVYILDISDPSNPVKLSEDIHSRGDIDNECWYDSSSHILYTIASAHIELWDVSNTSNPQKVGEFETPGSTDDIEIQGSYAYALDNGLYVIDISNPSNPQQVGFCDCATLALAVSGSYAYTVGNTYLRIIDISDPVNPYEVASCFQPGEDIFVAGSYAYIADDDYLRIIDISDPLNPQFAGYYVSPGNIHNLYVEGVYAYLANSSYFRIIDVSDPMNCVEVSNLTLFSYDIAVSMPYAYIVGETSFNVIDISDPANPQLTGTFSTPGKTHDVVISGLYAFIASHGSGLRIIDISDPEKAWEVGYCHTPSFGAHGVFVSGSYAYIAAHEGLSVIDISTLNKPEQVGYCETPGSAFDVFVSGHYAYIADWAFFTVIDISDPRNPTEVGQCDQIGDQVVVSGQYAFVCAEDIGKIGVIDISEPENPTEVNTIYLWSSVTGIWVSGMYLYATEFDFGLYVIDISDPLNPEIVGYRVWYDFSGVYVSGLYAYVIRQSNELCIFDISNPSHPDFVGWYQHYASLLYNAVYCAGRYIYIGDNNMGMQIYEFPATGIKEEEEDVAISSSMKILQNPVCRKKMEVMLAINSPNNFSIELFNTLGQKVKVYNLGNLTTGRNRIQLPIDQISNGIYFLRLNDGSNIQSEKVVILK
jgi:hypothetical protein